MWPIALAALAALAAPVGGSCDHDDVVYEPLNKTVQRLEFPGSLTWEQVEKACHEQFLGGFEMLSRDFLRLSAEDRALCRGHAVPIGLRDGVDDRVVWNRACLRADEQVTGKHLVAGKHGAGDRGKPPTAQVGSLDLETVRWQLVDNATTFDCAICQRGCVRGRDALEVEPPPRPPSFNHTFTLRLVRSDGGNVSLDEAIGLVEEHLQTKIERLDDREDSQGTYLGVTLLGLLPTFGNLSDLLRDAGYSIESWLDMDFCPPTRANGFDWKQTQSGTVAKADMPGYQIATKRCSWRSRPDGDWDSVWDDDVDFWTDHTETCRLDAVQLAVRRLRALGTHSRAPDLSALVQLGAELPSLDFPRDTFHESRANLSAALFVAMAAVQAPAARRECFRSACGFVSDRAERTLVVGRGAEPNFVDDGVAEPAFLSGGGSGGGFELNLRLPAELVAERNVALLVICGGQLDRYGSILLPLPDTSDIVAYASLLQISSPISLSEVPPARFLVNNSGRPLIARHFAVWTLGAVDETTLPCPWIDSDGHGEIDTYACGGFQPGPRDSTIATFQQTRFVDNASDWLASHVARVFRGYAAAALDEPALRLIAPLVDVVAGDGEKFSRGGFGDRGSIMSDLDRVLRDARLDGAFFVANTTNVKLLVSELESNGSDPIVGFSLERGGRLRAVTADRNVSAVSVLDAVLEKGGYRRLVVVIVVNSTGFYPDGVLDSFVRRRWFAAHIAVTPPEDVGVDILVHQGRLDDVSGSDAAEPGRYQVAAWSDADRDWSRTTCDRLRSTRGEKHVFRCQLNAGVGRFLVFEASSFVDSFGSLSAAVLAGAGILSGVSLASIVGSAVALPAWRRTLGHKILLQMALALSLNLALGFFTNLVELDSPSGACFAVGVLRHLFYLAMFAWLLVMSGLRLKRLVSVLGAVTTPNLLVKVSALAWGMPTAFVAAIAALWPDVYLSDAADRGFCYPDGPAFAWLVQFPAAATLTVNAGIFVAILARLYGCCGWGRRAYLRHHQNERSYQLRRLQSVFVTFCLFGIMWMFHLLAEQGVFAVRYLYEYLFLMTATVHLLALSCVFVFFDEQTCDEWRKVIGEWRDRF